MAAFCSKCGAHVEENERFCPKCGNEVTAGAAAPALAAAPAPVAQQTAPPPPAYAPPPPQAYVPPPAPPPVPPPAYGAPGPIPVMGVPQEAPKKNNTMWLVIGIALLGGGWYYYHNKQTPAPTPATQPQTAPQPGGAPPGPATPAQPGGPGPGGPNAALVQEQQWSSQEEPANGYVQVQNGKWVNGSNVAIQTAVLECDQYDTNNAVLAQNQTNLTLSNPPLVPGNNATFNSFNAGQIVQGVNTVNCGIVAVTPAQ